MESLIDSIFGFANGWQIIWFRGTHGMTFGEKPSLNAVCATYAIVQATIEAIVVAPMRPIVWLIGRAEERFGA